MEHNDRILIEAHLSGSADAFEMIVRRHGPAVYGYLVKMVKDTHKADDLFQETFQKAYEKIRDFRGIDMRPWIYSIATRLALNSLGKEKRTHIVSLDVQTDCPDGGHCLSADDTVSIGRKEPFEILEMEEKRRQVKQALMKLPQRQRITLILSYYQKLSYKQISEALNCSVGTVKTTMFRALKRLTDVLTNINGKEI